MTDAWDRARAAHVWELGAACNIAATCLDPWDADRLALVVEGGRPWSYGDLRAATARLANALAAHGIGRGDRVAVLLPQGAELLIAHFAAHRLAAIAVPLSTLFGPEALAVRLADMTPRAVICDAGSAARLAGLDPDALVLSVDGPGPGAAGFWQTLARARDTITPAATGPDDPAMLSYTSGTTGAPKGALHGHRVLAGHLPGVRLTLDGFPQPGDVAWTPADWAWMGGLCNVALPALACGVPLIAHARARFDPEAAVDLMARHGVRCAFLPPTALRVMRGAGILRVPGLRSIATAGESLGAGMIDWARGVFDLTPHEFYGQTECNMAVGNCASLSPVRPGSTGRAIPGTDVAILGPDGAVLPPDTLGEIALGGSAAMFLGYWNAPAATAAKFAGPWMRTGDEATMDRDGYVWFASRADDVITSSGYRIGPTEIEHCLVGHAAVALAAVVGLPDPLRTERVHGFVVPAAGVRGDDALAARLIAHVRDRLGAHLAPRGITFVESLPTTTTGKVLRRDLRARGSV